VYVSLFIDVLSAIITQRWKSTLFFSLEDIYNPYTEVAMTRVMTRVNS
jgi:hypothetical protein